MIASAVRPGAPLGSRARPVPHPAPIARASATRPCAKLQYQAAWFHTDWRNASRIGSAQTKGVETYRYEAIERQIVDAWKAVDTAAPAQRQQDAGKQRVLLQSR